MADNEEIVTSTDIIDEEKPQLDENKENLEERVRMLEADMNALYAFVEEFLLEDGEESSPSPIQTTIISEGNTETEEGNTENNPQSTPSTNQGMVNDGKHQKSNTRKQFFCQNAFPTPITP